MNIYIYIYSKTLHQTPEQLTKQVYFRRNYIKHHKIRPNKYFRRNYIKRHKIRPTGYIFEETTSNTKKLDQLCIFSKKLHQKPKTQLNHDKNTYTTLNRHEIINLSKRKQNPGNSAASSCVEQRRAERRATSSDVEQHRTKSLFL